MYIVYQHTEGFLFHVTKNKKDDMQIKNWKNL